jgi:sulfite reductase (ferredoxin)
VHLGGHLGDERAFGHKAKGVKVLASETGPYVETLIRRYRSRRNDRESFSAFVNRLSESEFKDFSSKPRFEGLPPAPEIVAEPRAS